MSFKKQREIKRKSKENIHISANAVGNKVVIDFSPTFNLGTGKTAFSISPDLVVKF